MISHGAVIRKMADHSCPLNGFLSLTAGGRYCLLVGTSAGALVEQLHTPLLMTWAPSQHGRWIPSMTIPKEQTDEHGVSESTLGRPKA